MYESFYGLNGLPFATASDPNFMFSSETHREALACLEFGVHNSLGFVMLTGEVGLGKTTVVRSFLASMDKTNVVAIFVFHPQLFLSELLMLMAEELGIKDAGVREIMDSPHELVRTIQKELIARYEKNEKVVVVIDEAHRLPPSTLEGLRLLSNLEGPGARLLHIILVGQPELQATLSQKDFRQLDQRIELKTRLRPLSRSEAIDYIRAKLALAGRDDVESVMTAPAIRAIAKLSRGIPRRINILANLALVEGLAADQRPITPATVRSAARSLAPPLVRRWKLAASVAVMVLGIIIGTASDIPQHKFGELIGLLRQHLQMVAEPAAAAPPVAAPALATKDASGTVAATNTAPAPAASVAASKSGSTPTAAATAAAASAQPAPSAAGATPPSVALSAPTTPSAASATVQSDDGKAATRAPPAGIPAMGGPATSEQAAAPAHATQPGDGEAATGMPATASPSTQTTNPAPTARADGNKVDAIAPVMSAAPPQQAAAPAPPAQVDGGKTAARAAADAKTGGIGPAATSTMPTRGDAGNPVLVARPATPSTLVSAATPASEDGGPSGGNISNDSHFGFPPISASGSSPAIPSAAPQSVVAVTADQQSAAAMQRRVAAGDTIWGLCRQVYGHCEPNQIGQIAERNKLSNANLIQVGKVINLATPQQ